MYVIVVGLSAVGKTLVHTLINRGHTVAVVDKNEERCKELASEVDALVLHGDAGETENLVNAGVEKADALIAATNDDSVNLMIASIAKDFNVQNLLVILRNPEHKGLFKKHDINTVSPDEIIAEHVYQSLFRVTDFFLVGKCRSEVFYVNVDVNSEAINKKIKDIHLSNGCQILGVVHEEKLIPPNSNLTLRAGDEVIVYIGKLNDFKRTTEFFMGRKV